ncbi:MAG: hypothetical protein ACJ8MO_23550, partial [Bacillus sp. (in: firmicutes)]
RLQCETKLLAFEDELSITREKLHLNIDEEDILAINTNIYMKNQVEVVDRKIQKEKEVKEELENQYQEEKGRLEDIEKEARLTERQVLTKQERLALEEKVNSGNDKQSIEGELSSLRDQIEFYHQVNERDKAAAVREGKQKKLQFLLFEVILISIAIYGLLSKQWFLLTLGFLGCMLLVIFITKTKEQPKQAEQNQTLHSLRKKEAQLKQKLQSAEYTDISKLEAQLTLDNERRQKLQNVNIKLKHQHAQYEKVIAKFEQWELETAQTNEKLVSISSELKIPKYIAESFLLESFKLIEQFKVISREKKQYLSRLQQLNQQQEKIVKGLNQFVHVYLNEQGLDLYNAAYLLRNKLKEEHRKQIVSQERLVKLTDLDADLRQKTQALKYLQIEYNNLLSSARVDTEQQFYELGALAEKKGNLLASLESLQSQLQYSILSELEREAFLQMHQSEELIAECNQQVHGLEGKQKKLQEEHAAIKYEIQILEEGGVYSDILHHYKQKKFELKEAAKEWSVYSLAQD